MDHVLCNYLPAELVDIIAKEVHRLHLQEVHEQLLGGGVVWILNDGNFFFWVCNSYNRYAVLSDDEIWVKMHLGKK